MSMWKKGIIGVLIVLVHLTGNSDGCLEWERRGLLEFKSFLKSNGSDANHLLPTWVDEKPDDHHHHQQIQSECCDWERVTCDPTTGHVTELSLDNIKNLAYGDYKNIWIINASLFLPFEELRSLNLSYNLFSGWAHNEGFERLSNLWKLEILDLGGNNFYDNNIFRSLSAVTSIKTLILSYNALGGYFPAHELVTLEKLETLDIRYNGYQGCLPMQDFEKLLVLRKLETLNLEANQFDGSVLPPLRALRSLKMLNLGLNHIGGLFPAHEIANFQNLEWLDISNNELHGIQGFEKLSALRKLETLKLESNEFNDSILPSLSALRSLKMLDLRANKIGGLFPAHELAYFENLERLDLSENQLNGIQGCESLSRLEKLQTLYLGQNNFNKSVILCFSSLTSLKSLSLSGNNLGDLFPARELTVLENLEILDLGFNELSSLTMQDSKILSKLSKMRHLDLSANHFDKNVLRILGALPSLKFLSLEDNGMEGPLSNQELTYNLSKLEVLLLRGNGLNGTLPMEGLASFSHLEILDLNKNNFVGSIPSSIGALSSLQALSMAGNELNGSLPIQGLCKLKKLEKLDLSNNLFDGGLPSCLSNLRSLKSFDLSFNQFTRNISPSLLSSLNSLEYIDISHNCFEGVFSFGSFANHSNLRVVKMISDNDKFEVETEDTNWIPRFQLKILILSNCKLNKLSGAIPKFLIHQNKLRFIDLC